MRSRRTATTLRSHSTASSSAICRTAIVHSKVSSASRTITSVRKCSSKTFESNRFEVAPFPNSVLGALLHKSLSEALGQPDALNHLTPFKYKISRLRKKFRCRSPTLPSPTLFVFADTGDRIFSSDRANSCQFLHPVREAGLNGPAVEQRRAGQRA
jgi:hypothetical protein